MSDLWTMVWKEWKDLLGSGGPADWFRPLLIVGVMGIVLPLSGGQSWLDLGPAPFLIMVYVPFLLLATFIGDAVAGERERHTLETLLASRIPDWAILLGKILVTAAFSWGLAVFSLLLGALVVNLSQGLWPWQFYSPLSRFWVVVVLSILTTLLAASGGVLISLKSATVRQAAQTIVAAELLLALAIFGIVRLLPESLAASLTESEVVLGIIVILAVLDALLLAAALAGFRRARLMRS
jgi:ABC-2 type transport system permease protein